MTYIAVVESMSEHERQRFDRTLNAPPKSDQRAKVSRSSGTAELMASFGMAKR